jgi:hypothetical protein
MRHSIRHGEVLLQEVESVPKRKGKEFKSFIVGHSETGHHHVLEAEKEFKVWTAKDKQELYLELFEPAKLVHQKQIDAHKTLTVPKGKYKVTYKKEYNPWSKVTQRVFD